MRRSAGIAMIVLCVFFLAGCAAADESWLTDDELGKAADPVKQQSMDVWMGETAAAM